jgi:hypothetical protein
MNCFDCKNFFVTWENKFPYGCRAYEIKSKSAPNIQVLENTGLACLLFELKKPNTSITKSPKEVLKV